MLRKTCLLVLLMVWCHATAAFSGSAATGTLSGKIAGKNGESMSGGRVLIFRADSGPAPSRQRYWRTPDEIAEISEDGSFKATLRAGTYYLAAIKRLSGEFIGPPEDGDLIYPQSRNDLKGENREYAVKEGRDTKVGVIAEAVPFKKAADVANGPITAVEGTVLDEEGRPVSGAMAFAYAAADMTGKPLFASARTGKDGKYSLRVGGNGRFYIKARNTRSGGHPVDGELMGQYGKEQPVAVAVKSGETVQNIDIVAKRFSGPYTPRMATEKGSGSHGPKN